MKIYTQIKTTNGEKKNKAFFLPPNSFKDRQTLISNIQQKAGNNIDSIKIKGNIPQWAKVLFF